MGDRRIGEDAGRFDLALLGIVLVIASSAASDTSGWWRLISLVIEGAVLVFVLRTAGARRATQLVAGTVAIVAVVGATIGLFWEGGEWGARSAEAVALLFVLAMPAAIVRRVAREQRVDGTVVAGALCIYLLLGLAFAVGYGVLDGSTSGDFFAQTGAPTQVDFTYFSFVTLTTVGFGDLTAATDLGRLLAVTEALLGQLYLVTVVALAVSRVGTERRRPA